MRSVIERIARGDWSPGEMLPREQDLAARFRISRGVARESIQALEDRGVVRVKHGRGSTIAPPAEWNVLDPVVLDGLLAAPGGRALRDEVLEARLAVEEEVAALAARRAGKEELGALQTSLGRMGELAQRRRLVEEDAEDLDAAERAFHAGLAAAAGNRLLGRTLAPLQGATPISAASAAARSRIVHGYAELVDAVAARDEGAARATVRELVEGAAAGRGSAAG